MSSKAKRLRAVRSITSFPFSGMLGLDGRYPEQLSDAEMLEWVVVHVETLGKLVRDELGKVNSEIEHLRNIENDVKAMRRLLA